MARVATNLRYGVAFFAAFISVSAYFGTIGLGFGLLPIDATMSANLPFQSPVFGGLALAVIVAMPTTWLTWLAWHGHPRTADAATLAGLLLLGWIAVEVVIIGEFSVLQAVYAVAGAVLLTVGSRAMLRHVAAAVMVLPLLATAPLYRRYHTRWGATGDEVTAGMPGDDLIERAQLVATRAVTIQAPAAMVWQWLAQVGFGRAGFYSIDLIDNLGRSSASEIHSVWQYDAVGDIVAPMSARVTPATSFLVTQSDYPTGMVWAKPDSTWSWQLTSRSDGSTRLVTRIRVRYRATASGLLSIVLMEFGDFAMMRAMLGGLKRRAESTPIPTSREHPAEA
jgi:hypothetical protein